MTAPHQHIHAFAQGELRTSKAISMSDSLRFFRRHELGFAFELLLFQLLGLPASESQKFVCFS